MYIRFTTYNAGVNANKLKHLSCNVVALETQKMEEIFYTYACWELKQAYLYPHIDIKAVINKLFAFTFLFELNRIAL